MLLDVHYSVIIQTCYSIGACNYIFLYIAFFVGGGVVCVCCGYSRAVPYP